MRTRLLAVFLTAVLASVSEAQKVQNDSARWHCLDKIPVGICRDAIITYPRPNGRVDTVKVPASSTSTSVKDSTLAPKATQSGLSTKIPQASNKASRSTTVGLPFYDKPAGKAIYAWMIEHGKGTAGITFNTKSENVISAWNKAYPDLGLENRQDLANHIRSMQVVPCPRVRTGLAWVVEISRDVRLDGWARELGTGVHDGEQCLLNTEKHRIEASLLCGNIILNLPYDVPAPAPTSRPEVPVAKEFPREAPPPPAPPTLELTADSYTVPYNTGTMLHWLPQRANECIAATDWSGGKLPTGSTEYSGNLTKQSIFGLQCFGPGGHVYKSVTVNVLPEVKQGGRKWPWIVGEVVGAAVVTGATICILRNQHDRKCDGSKHQHGGLNITNININGLLGVPVTLGIRLRP